MPGPVCVSKSFRHCHSLLHYTHMHARAHTHTHTHTQTHTKQDLSRWGCLSLSQPMVWISTLDLWIFQTLSRFKLEASSSAVGTLRQATCTGRRSCPLTSPCGLLLIFLFTTFSPAACQMHGCCHAWPWFIEFSSVAPSCFTLSLCYFSGCIAHKTWRLVCVALSCFTLSPSAVFPDVSLIKLEDSFNSLFKAMVYYSMSEV